MADMSDLAGTALAHSVTRLPHPRLRDLVMTYHGYRYEGLEPGMHHGLPATSLTMVLAFDQPVDVGWLADPESRRFPAMPALEQTLLRARD